MQITFDASSRLECAGVRAMIDVMHPRAAATPAEAAVITPADNPATGLDTKELFATAAVMLHPVSNVVPLVQPVTPSDRDSEGFPWDARIHSSTQKKTDSGAWQLKRGINNDKAMLARVRAELLSTAALPVSAPPQTANVAPVFPQAQAAAPAVTLPVALPVITPVQTLPALPPVIQADPQTVAELMVRVGPSLASLKMPPSAIQAACTKLGIPGLEALVSANRPDLVVAVWKELQPLTV